jgi:hypothetical protein
MGVRTSKGGAPHPLLFVNVASKELKEEEQGSNEVTR